MPYGLLGVPTALEMIDAYGYDADARRYIRDVENADKQPLELGVRNAINEFVIGCKNDGLWPSIKASCILCGARTLAGALTPLAGSSPTNTNFVSGDYNRKTGLNGNGSNKYIITNRANNADGQNDQHMAVYASAAPTGNGAYMASSAGVTGGSQIFVASGTSLNFRNRNTDTPANVTGISANPVGFLGHTRSESGNYICRFAGRNVIGVSASQAPNSNIIRVFDIPGFGFTSDARVAFYSIGGNLTLSALDTRISNLYAAIGGAIP